MRDYRILINVCSMLVFLFNQKRNYTFLMNYIFRPHNSLINNNKTFTTLCVNMYYSAESIFCPLIYHTEMYV